jgi:hypothetical protein
LVAAVVVMPLPPCRRWQAAAVTRPQLMVHLPPLLLCWAGWQAAAGVVVNGGNVLDAAVASGSKQRWGNGQGLRRTAAGGRFLWDVKRAYRTE